MLRRLLALALLSAGPALAETPVLTVYTYDSFATDYGPGPAIETGFEATCGCDLRFVTAGDGAALLSRLRLEGARSKADVVVGLDSNQVADARATGLFAGFDGPAPKFNLPVEWDDRTFLPFDWGYFAFVYDKTRIATPPDSFEALAASDLKVAIEDPRASTPGLGLVLWVEALYGDRAEALWASLAPRILTVTPAWSEAYGLFLSGEADMVLSYTTSPAYHLIAEDDPTKAAAPFASGHYLQVEVAAKLAGSAEPELADRFLGYLMSDAAQKVLPTTNWMYPAVTPAEGLPAGFEQMIRPKTAIWLTPEDAAKAAAPAIEAWRTGLSR